MWAPDDTSTSGEGWGAGIKERLHRHTPCNTSSGLCITAALLYMGLVALHGQAPFFMIMATVTEHLAAGNYPAFYRSKAWRRLRADVLAYDRHECQICRARGKYTRADHVHHVMHVDKRPDLALRKTYTATGGEEKRNLISVCKACHEKECHPERLPYRGREPEPPLTPERW